MISLSKETRTTTNNYNHSQKTTVEERIEKDEETKKIDNGIQMMVLLFCCVKIRCAGKKSTLTLFETVCQYSVIKRYKQQQPRPYQQTIQHEMNTNNQVESKHCRKAFCITQCAPCITTNTMNPSTTTNLLTNNTNINPNRSQTQMPSIQMNQQPQTNQNHRNNITNILTQTIPQTAEISDTTEVSTLSTQVPSIYLNYNTPSNIINVAKVIRTKLFHRYKYVRSKSDLEYSTEEHAVSQIVLNELSVIDDENI